MANEDEIDNELLSSEAKRSAGIYIHMYKVSLSSPDTLGIRTEESVLISDVGVWNRDMVIECSQFKVCWSRSPPYILRISTTCMLVALCAHLES